MFRPSFRKSLLPSFEIANVAVRGSLTSSPAERDLKASMKRTLPYDVLRDFAPVTLVGEERTLKGSYIGTAVPARDIPRYIALYRRGRLPVDRLKSGTLRLEEINEGFDRLHEGKAIRQVVVL